MNRRSSTRFASSAKTLIVKFPVQSRYSGPRSDQERVVAQREFQQHFAGQGEMVVPEGNLGGPEGLLFRPHQVHPAGDRLAGVLIDHGQFELPGRRKRRAIKPDER